MSGHSPRVCGQPCTGLAARVCGGCADPEIRRSYAEPEPDDQPDDGEASCPS